MTSSTPRPASDAPSVVALIGMRGVGKTTVGRLIATRLGSTFVDLDDAACGRLHVTTPAAAFATLGEPAWREAECQSLCDILGDVATRHAVAPLPPLILAIGGGALTHAPTEERLVQSKPAVWVIWLHASIPCLATRIAGDVAKRPSLLGGDVLEELPTLAARRESGYRHVADYAADASGSPESLSEGLVSAFAGNWSTSGS